MMQKTKLKEGSENGIVKETLGKATNISGSDIVMRSIILENTKHVFGYPGGAIMPIYDALFNYDDHVSHILTRHEQGSIHAAQGYARATGKIGVCFATSGPGATNLITGLADALIDSTPLVCITGQVAFKLIGTDAFQETDVIGISMPVTKWNVQVVKAEDLASTIAKAFFIANTGRKGPVLIDISKNAQVETTNFEYKKCNKIRSYVPRPKVDLSNIKKAASIINGSKKPLALIGQGVILGNAENELKEFLEKTGVPAAWTLLGMSALPTDHSLNMGMLGMHGNYATNVLTNQSDAIIAIGMRFDDRVTGDVSRYAVNGKIIHLEIDRAEINKNIKADVAVLGDVKDSLPLLKQFVIKRNHNEWIENFKKLDTIEHQKVIKKSLYPETDGLRMGEVVRRLTEKTNGDAILVTDVGQHQMIASRYFKFKSSRSNITSGGLGTMGFALPAALGAKIGRPDRTVIAVIGDGGFQMTLQELATIDQMGCEINIVILNNNYLGMVRQWQEMFFKERYSFVDLKNPNFVKLSESFGIKASKVSDRKDIDSAIDEMLSHKGSYLLEVIVEKLENVFPMIPSGASVSDILLEP